MRFCSFLPGALALLATAAGAAAAAAAPPAVPGAILLEHFTDGTLVRPPSARCALFGCRPAEEVVAALPSPPRALSTLAC